MEHQEFQRPSATRWDISGGVNPLEKNHLSTRTHTHRIYEYGQLNIHLCIRFNHIEYKKILNFVYTNINQNNQKQTNKHIRGTQPISYLYLTPPLHERLPWWHLFRSRCVPRWFATLRWSGFASTCPRKGMWRTTDHGDITYYRKYIYIYIWIYGII